MIDLPKWIIDELGPFASGARSWNEWGNWLAISAAQASRVLPQDWFERIKANPEVEVLQMFASAGIEVTPHVEPPLNSHPLDTNAHFAAVVELAEQLAELEVGGQVTEMGRCHLVWAAKKRILKFKFGLEWESPADLNPDVFFD